MTARSDRTHFLSSHKLAKIFNLKWFRTRKRFKCLSSTNSTHFHPELSNLVYFKKIKWDFLRSRSRTRHQLLNRESSGFPRWSLLGSLRSSQILGLDWFGVGRDFQEKCLLSVVLWAINYLVRKNVSKLQEIPLNFLWDAHGHIHKWCTLIPNPYTHACLVQEQSHIQEEWHLGTGARDQEGSKRGTRKLISQAGFVLLYLVFLTYVGTHPVCSVAPDQHWVSKKYSHVPHSVSVTNKPYILPYPIKL
jgi:hypothetical protein